MSQYPLHESESFAEELEPSADGRILTPRVYYSKFTTDFLRRSRKDAKLFLFPPPYRYHGLVLECIVCKERGGTYQGLYEKSFVTIDGYRYYVDREDCKSMFVLNPLAYENEEVDSLW